MVHLGQVWSRRTAAGTRVVDGNGGVVMAIGGVTIAG